MDKQWKLCHNFNIFEFRKARKSWKYCIESSNIRSSGTSSGTEFCPRVDTMPRHNIKWSTFWGAI